MPRPAFAELSTILSAVVVPSGATVTLADIEMLSFVQAASSNCSVFVNKFTRALSTGLAAEVDWVAWLPGSSLTEMLE
jgi:hypothetical protein